ncbi:hypothetical protein QR680_019248 [Steinernema hermaphroditum]|uniref:Peptidase C1A papain C-terminal domain-containing protein n=1 Tax=Steinernema hermaphroditum TaxID=289476 RepID=A0AA39HLF8_9BILA|nr:hypothetical protein QR680_019248 [Steinernema hermaphroditum]
MEAAQDYGSTDQLINADRQLKFSWGFDYVDKTLKKVKIFVAITVFFFLLVLLLNAASLVLVALSLFKPDPPCHPLNGSHTTLTYENYLQQFHTNISTHQRAFERLHNYKKSVRFIQELNAKSNVTTFGLTKFADWSDEEIRTMLLPSALNTTELLERGVLNMTLPPLPLNQNNESESFDWRTRKVITEVKNQGLCGSCWAFAATGVVEAANAIASGSAPISLSEQELVDCDTANVGCFGGSVIEALLYIKINGSMSEESYPYEGARGPCRKDGYVSTITAIIWVENTEKALINWLHYYGPFTISLAVTKDFFYYTSGVYVPQDDCSDITKIVGYHAMLVVGYGIDETGVKYWIVKNSWGEKWGMNGYVNYIRGQNACGIREIAIAAYGSAMKDYGSAEFLLKEQLEQEKWRRFENILQRLKTAVVILFALLIAVLLLNVASIYLVAKASGSLQNLSALDGYQKFPEKATSGRKSLDRFQIYDNKLKIIKELNDRLDDTEFEDNRFTDWSDEEIRKILLPLDFDLNNLKNDTFLNSTHSGFFTASRSTAGTFDWRTKNVIAAVKDQGQCGSCWAFATTGLVEAMNAISKSVAPISLSEQELVDCDTIDKGCEGGNVGYAVRYVYQKGLMTEQSYPYQHSKGTCRKSGFVSKITNAYLLKRDEAHLVDWLTHRGPFTVSINVTNDLMYYKTGVFQPQADDCVNKPIGRHALLVVGYGTNAKGVKYWIVKNSWGSSWGTENGYLYFVRGQNACGIEEFPIGALA